VKEFCPHCHQSIMKHKHSMTPKLVDIFIKSALAKVPFHLQKDVEFTKNEYANFQKLHYWEIVSRDKKDGYWYITELGNKFLRGAVPLCYYVVTFNNTVIEKSTKSMFIDQMRKGKRFYMNRNEYAKMAEPVNFERDLS